MENLDSPEDGPVGSNPKKPGHNGGLRDAVPPMANPKTMTKIQSISILLVNNRIRTPAA